MAPTPKNTPAPADTKSAKTKVQSFDIARSDETLELAKDLAKFIKDNKLSTTVQGKEFVNVAPWVPNETELRLYEFVPMHEAKPKMPFGAYPGWWSGAKDRFRLDVGAGAFNQNGEIVIRREIYGSWTNVFLGKLHDVIQFAELLFQVGYLQAISELSND